MYCRNCGIADYEYGTQGNLIPTRFHALDLCTTCHHLPVIGYHFNYLTGAPLPKETVTMPLGTQSDEAYQKPYQLFTFNEAAQFLKISRSTMHRLLRNGSLKGHKVGDGAHWRFTLQQLKGALK